MEKISTFIFVNIAWVFFRAPSVEDACILLKNVIIGGTGFIHESLYRQFDQMMEVSIFMRADILGLFTKNEGVYAALFTGILLTGCLCMKNTKEKAKEFQCTVKNLLLSAGVLFYSILSFSGISEFIYFNF